MKNIKKKKFEKNNFNLLEVIVITLAFSSLSGIITGLFFYFKNNRNLILDKNLLDIVGTYNKISEDFYGNLDKEKLATNAINGMMSSLDETYTVHMDQSDTSSMSEKLDGKYHGVGISVQKKGTNIEVINVYDKTPASTAGLKVGDILKKVNGYEILESDQLEKVSNMIKEQDKVTLEVKREEELLTIDIDVKTIEYPSVTSKVYEKNNKKIGYIYISTFSKTASKQVKESLETLEQEQIASLIIDVRGNTGGYLDTCDSILNMFMKKGNVLYSVEAKDGNKQIYDTTNSSRIYDIVVLVDRTSASASEILATSLKESYGAILIGTTTFGKGLVQQTNFLSDKSMIKYTTAKWFTPKGNYVNEIGYKPDIEVKLTKEYALNPNDANDTQLQKAIDVLSK
ncbi:MAG: S41 family peptidase [Bacilli bacterium]|nr:S41 family peptidase [Bacilli bacterium]